MARGLVFGASALFVVLVSGLIVALPVAGAASTVQVTMPSGAGNGPSSAPGYSPDSVTVVIGVNNTVTWTNDDSVDHTVASLTVPAGAANFTSPLIPAGGSFTETFTVAGTYDYHCTLHSWMTGTVVVKAAPTPTPEFPAAYLAAVLFTVIVAALVAVPRMRPAVSTATRRSG